MNRSLVLDFYDGTGTDNLGRCYDEYMYMDADHFEKDHTFIQWLFPLENSSMANPWAPIIVAQDKQAFRLESTLRSKMEDAFELMLSFYGLYPVPTAEGHVVVVESHGDEAKDRRAVWMKNGSHHHRRFSRMMLSMMTLGLRSQAFALLRYLWTVDQANTDLFGETAARAFMLACTEYD